MRSLKLRDYTLKYIEAGEGQPMLFLHNGGSGHWIWQHQIEHFSKSYRVLAFDMVGCGSSDRPDVPYDLNLYAEMVEQIIAALNLSNLVIVGNCVGAAAALEYAIRDSSKLSALVLCNVCGGTDMMTPMVRAMSTLVPKFAVKYLRYIPGVIKAAVNTNYGSAPDIKNPVYMAEMKEARNPIQTQTRIHLIAGIKSFNKFSHPFHRPNSLPPICVFWGERNKVLPASRGIEFCKVLRPEECHIIPGTGHFLMAEKFGEVNKKIDGFLSKVLG